MTKHTAADMIKITAAAHRPPINVFLPVKSIKIKDSKINDWLLSCLSRVDRQNVYA